MKRLQLTARYGFLLFWAEGLKGLRIAFKISKDFHGDIHINSSFHFKGWGALFRNVDDQGGLRAPHTAYGDAPNNVQQISKYKNHGKKS